MGRRLDFDFKELNEYKIPMLMMCLVSALVGGQQGSFLRASTMSFQYEDGLDFYSTMTLISLTAILSAC
jgi:hypothetical protein